MLSLWPKLLWLVLIFPATSLAWEPGIAAPVPTRGFAVDSNDRNDVVSFYHAVYMASEGYQHRVAWTGNYNSVAAGAEGTVSHQFVGDMERRLNFLRALCGVNADVRINTGATVKITSGDAHVPNATTTKAAAAQRSALMIIRTYPGNGGLSHNPASNITAWTPAAWNANKNGNLALGFFGPGAIDAYAREDVMGISAWNVDVGHRRWLLAQNSRDFATGDTPGVFNPSANTIRPPTNSLYVVPKPSEEIPTVPPIFATFPAKGFFPASLNSPYWSISFPGADFSSATVSMTDSSSNPVAVAVVSRRIGFGDNSLVWQVPAAAAARTVTSDTRWNVTVSNIKGEGIPSSYSYPVTIIDPNVVLQTPLTSGTSTPLTTGSGYQLTTVPGADRMEARFFLRQGVPWSEGAEDSPVGRVIDRTSGNYTFRGTIAGYAKSGSKAFRLTFPTRYDPFINGVPEQSFELGRSLIPGSAAKLNFHFRRGLMTSVSKLVAEYSTNSGRTWDPLGNPISGLGSSVDGAYQSASLDLPSGLEPMRVRFRYYLADPQSAIYSHQDYPSQPTGIFIDDISTSDCDWLHFSGAVSGHNLSSFQFDSTTAGATLTGGQQWWLRSRAVLGGKTFSYGPSKVVTVSGPLQLSGPASPPVSGASYDFIADPSASAYKFEVASLQPSAWLEGAEPSSTSQIIPGNAVAYSLYSNAAGYQKSGSHAFRLALSNGSDAEDHFVINRDFVPSSGSTLNFWMRRGAMSPTNRIHAEISENEGATWFPIWSLPGLTKAESTVNPYNISLAEWAQRSIRVRFVIRKAAGGSTLKWNANTSGVWLDDISVTSASSLLSVHESPVSASSAEVILDETSAGDSLHVGATLRLRLRAVSGSSEGSWGPALLVSPSSEPSIPPPSTFAAWATGLYPGVELSFDEDLDGDGLRDGIEYAFSLDPTDGLSVADELSLSEDRLEISRNLPLQRTDLNYNAEWSDDLSSWSSEGIQIRFEDGKVIASVTRTSSGRYLRWKIERK